MRSTRPVLIAAPMLIATYGVLRLLGRADGQYGPGLDWQLAHLAGLAGMVLFAPAVLTLGRLLPRTPWRAVAVGVTLVGLACAVVQFGADIVEGLMAADKAELKALSHQFTSVPGVTPAFYAVGPQLFFVGLLALTVLLAAAKRVPWRTPVLTLIAVTLPPLTLDLLPLTGLLLLAALWPAAARNPAPVVAR